MKEIKASEYIQFVRASYIYLKLTPNNSIRNNATDGIAKAIASLYTSVWEQIDIEERKLLPRVHRLFVYPIRRRQ